MRKQYSIEEQEKHDSVLFQSMVSEFTLERITEVREYNSIQHISEHVRSSFCNRAVKQSKVQGTKPWRRSETPYRGAMGSLRSYLVGFSLGVSWEVREAFIAAASGSKDSQVVGAKDSLTEAFDLLMEKDWIGLARFSMSQIKEAD